MISARLLCCKVLRHQGSKADYKSHKGHKHRRIPRSQGAKEPRIFLSGFRIFPDFLPGFQKFSITLTVIYFYIIFLSLIFSEFFRIFFGFFNSLIVSYFELYFWNNRISFKFFSFSAFFCLFKFWFFVLFIIICSKVFELLCHEFFTEASLFPDYQWAFDTKIIVMNVWQYWRSVVSTKNGSNTNITHINLVWMYDLWFMISRRDNFGKYYFTVPYFKVENWAFEAICISRLSSGGKTNDKVSLLLIDFVTHSLTQAVPSNYI